MTINKEKNNENDIDRVKNFLKTLGFVCSSYPSAQHLIYTKENNTVIIKNNNK